MCNNFHIFWEPLNSNSHLKIGRGYTYYTLIPTNMNLDDHSLKLYIIVLCLMYIYYIYTREEYIYIYICEFEPREGTYSHTRIEYNNSNTSLSSLSLLNSVSVKSCPFSVEFLLYLLRLYI